jgi:flagellum-specific ATP synthase
MDNQSMLSKYQRILDSKSFVRYSGKVTKVVGLTIESEGPETHVGALCMVKARGNKSVMAEVVGFRDKSVLLMPIGDMAGIGPGSSVVACDRSLEVGVGPAFWGVFWTAWAGPWTGWARWISKSITLLKICPQIL